MKSTFEIYSASAGSGKTFTLAKSYLKLLIDSPNPEYFKHILAITFTNKAVGEMKSRIIDMLKTFSFEDPSENLHPMFLQICEELGISPKRLKEKSSRILKHIIYNYGTFDISTIDGFTHRVIRTFAFDLKLPNNFEVELDEDLLFSKAVDQLIARAGTDKILTRILVDFAIEKANEDKSWDISYDFNNIAKLLVSENDLRYLNEFKDKTLKDFSKLKHDIYERISTYEIKIKESSRSVLVLIEECGLEFGDFSGSYLPKHFLKLAHGNFNVVLDSKWQENLLEGGILYPKRVSEHVASTVNDIQPTLAEAFHTTRSQIHHLRFLRATYKNLTPLSVLNAIQKELQQVKDDENKILISEFNTIVSNEIKNQPTPFIYERLGEKFKHYFIDEFQDTSKMQWQNLVPLIDNTLASEYGTAMLVGDAKQAIYRWRGGEAKQFINLYHNVENPFQVTPKVHSLDINYRSHKAVVHFNNSLFDFISNHCFSLNSHSLLYSESKQEIHDQNEGYVNLSFLEFENSVQRNEAYCEKALDIVQDCLNNGYVYSDISILVRKKKEGIAIADYLTQHNIPVVSSETLLIKNAPKIQLVNNFLTLLIQPKDIKRKALVLNGIADMLNIENKHKFFKVYLDLELPEMLNSLSEHHIYIRLDDLLQMPLYTMVETIIRSLKLIDSNTPDGYIQFYLDTVLDFSQNRVADISGFLEYFEKRKDSLSIATPANLNAISVMTIHKAKGLEFPVVIFPYADLDIYKEIEPKIWIPLDLDVSNGFNYVLVDFKKDVQYYGDTGQDLYNEHRSELELDNMNLLYVVLTRAIEQLYVVSKKDFNRKGEINQKTYSGILIKFLEQQNLWNRDQFIYEFGNLKTKIQSDANFIKTSNYEFISTPKESHNLRIVANSGYLWNTVQEKAIERGNLIHLVLSKIKTTEDVYFALDEMLANGQIESQEYEGLSVIISDIVNHPDLKSYFTNGYDVYNEKDIIKSDGRYLRPDRICVKENIAIVIDYKTGEEDPMHTTQINDYADALLEMNYSVEKKLIVYINESLRILEVK